MFEEQLGTTCEECERELGDPQCMLVYRTERGERRAYECACGAVTITVHR
jgi:hypothetical protein